MKNVKVGSATYMYSGAFLSFDLQLRNEMEKVKVAPRHTVPCRDTNEKHQGCSATLSSS